MPSVLRFNLRTYNWTDGWETGIIRSMIPLWSKEEVVFVMYTVTVEKK